MDIAEHINALETEGRLLAAAADEAGLDAPVPTCPGWQVRDLLRHTGMVHRWATRFVAEGATEFVPDAGEPELDGTELLKWFQEGHDLLVAALRTAPADLECWSFMPAPSPVAFWARRQAHETTVHRLDAESARATPPSGIDAAFADDGIDELLRAFHARAKSRVRTPEPRTLRIRATDTGTVWTVHLSAAPPRAERTDEGLADCELSGPANVLYAALWNRLPLSRATVTGDESLARLWRETSAIGW